MCRVSVLKVGINLHINMNNNNNKDSCKHNKKMTTKKCYPLAFLHAYINHAEVLPVTILFYLKFHPVSHLLTYRISLIINNKINSKC